jgi:hypothetical protein
MASISATLANNSTISRFVIINFAPHNLYEINAVELLLCFLVLPSNMHKCVTHEQSPGNYTLHLQFVLNDYFCQIGPNKSPQHKEHLQIMRRFCAPWYQFTKSRNGFHSW